LARSLTAPDYLSAHGKTFGSIVVEAPTGGTAFVSFSGADRDEKQSRRKQKENQMDMRKYVGNVFLKVEHVKAIGPIRVRITGISEGQYGRPNATFDDGSQLSLNNTNCRTLLRAYGIESRDLIGKEIELTVGEIQYRGEPKEVILVKPISPPIENKAPPKPEFDDQIPF
jgi:hypothetical protein